MKSPEINKLINFLLRHKEFALEIISGYYPFTRDELQIYSDKLDWFSVSINEAIVWNEKLYKEFSDKISLCALSNNKKFPWTEEFIDKHYIELFQLDDEDAFPGMISLNPSLPFNKELLQKYKEIWLWDFLSSNPGIPFTLELIEEFKDYWIYQEFEHNDTIIADPILKFHLGVNASLNSFEKLHSCLYCNMEMYDVFEKNSISLYEMFHCPNFKWDFYLLRLIKENIDKKKDFRDQLIYLEESSTVPWSTELLELFENDWNYHMLPMNNYVGKYIGDAIKEATVLDALLNHLTVSNN